MVHASCDNFIRTVDFQLHRDSRLSLQCRVPDRLNNMQKENKSVCKMSALWSLFFIGVGALIHFAVFMLYSDSGSFLNFDLRTSLSFLQVNDVNNGQSHAPVGRGVPASTATQAMPIIISMETNNGTRCAPFPVTFDSKATLFPCHFDWNMSSPCDQRLQASLACSDAGASIVYQWVSVNTSPTLYQYEDTCLERVIKERCYDGKVTPKVMHFVSFNRRELPFYGVLSVVSAVRFIQPCLVLFHGDYLPFGRYWDTLVRLVPNVLHVNRSIPKSIFGRVINVIEHSTDVARLEAVKKFGGIYMDMDHVLLNPLDGLRNYTVVMGTEVPGSSFGNGMFMGKAGAKFFEFWYEAYNSFNDNQWAVHSTLIPNKLHEIFPHLEFHVENTFFRPDWSHIKNEFYLKKFDWSKSYGMHLYFRGNKEFFQGKVEKQNSSLGEICRHVLYGNSSKCFESDENIEPERMKV